MSVIQSGEYLVDPETGEVVGMAAKLPFQIETMEHVEWLAEKLFNLNAEEDMLNAKLKSYTENMRLMMNENKRKREWLERRFFTDAAAVVQENCPKNAKSVKTPFGRAGFQKTGGGIKIVEGSEEFAVEWCKENAPDAVKKVETVLVSKLPEELPELIFTRVPVEEKFYIK